MPRCGLNPHNALDLFDCLRPGTSILDLNFYLMTELLLRSVALSRLF